MKNDQSTFDHTPAGAEARSDERGAVLVEFSLIAVLLVGLVLGVFEIGMAWSDHQVLTQTSRNAARVGSQLGTAGEADREMLRSIEASMSGSNLRLTRIVIYEADVNGDMPVGCQGAAAGYTGAARCNVYDDGDIANLSSNSNWGSGSSCGSSDSNWCATTRDDTQATSTYLGVQVEVERDFLTGMFGGGTQQITEHTVMRIEPNIN